MYVFWRFWHILDTLSTKKLAQILFLSAIEVDVKNKLMSHKFLMNNIFMNLKMDGALIVSIDSVN